MFLLDGKVLPLDTAFVHNEIQYPANWLRLASTEEKAALGVLEAPDPIRPDDRFYYVSDDGSAVPKDLAVLKADWTKIVDGIAYSLLLPSDWMVVRKAEGGAAIPADWETYRAAVRTATNAHRAAVAAAADVPALIAAVTSFDWPKDPNAPQL